MAPTWKIATLAENQYELHFVRSDRSTQVVPIIAASQKDATRHARLIVRDQPIEIHRAGRLVARVGRTCADICRDMFGASAAAIESS